jgi:transcriptional regulator with XRE-family HTH domain
MKSNKSTRIKQISPFAERFRAAFGGARDAEIARQLGYKSQSPLTKFMTGESYPSAEILIETARITKVDLHWLLTGEGDPNADPLSVIGPDLLVTVDEITELRKVSREEMIHDLVYDALLDRYTAVLQRHNEGFGLETDELREFQILHHFFGNRVPHHNNHQARRPRRVS